MAVNPIYRSNPIRMMGMASGMDTESIIQATLRMHQFKIDKQMKNKTLIEWKQQYHNDIKNQITNLRDTYLRALGPKSLMTRNAFNANLATMTTASGKTTNAVTVAASVNSSLGSFKITAVKQLATGTNITTAGNVSASGSGFNPASTLGSLTFANGPLFSSGDPADRYMDVKTESGVSTRITEQDVNNAVFGNEMSKFYIGGKEVILEKTGGGYTLTVDGDPETITDEGGGQFSFTVGSVNVEFNENAAGNGVEYTAKEGDKEISKGTVNYHREAEITTDEGIVKIYKDHNNKTFVNGNATEFFGSAMLYVQGTGVELKSNMTINQMVDAVNAVDSNIKMTYDRMNDKFVIETKATGANAGPLAVTGDANVMNAIFGGATVQSADKAIIEINGEDFEFDSNQFDFRGVNIKLNDVTGPLAPEDQITVNVARDTNRVVDAIKDFLESYNSLISKLEGLLNDRKTSKEAGYTPLTDEEKAGMTEKQIEEWEAIAKKGILRNDYGIQNLVTNLRASFFEQIEGTGMSASQLGLTTGPWNGGTGGQIILTEEGEAKLRAALAQDPDKVADVFIKIDYSSGQAQGAGLLYKLDKLMGDYVRLGGTQSNTLDALERSLKEENDRIDKLTERMWAEEDKLYKQFAAMETALSNMQSQGDWFSAMLGTK